MNPLNPLRGVLSRWWPGRGERILGVFSIFIAFLATLTLFSGPTRATKAALGERGVLGKVNEHLNPFRSRRSLQNSGLDTYDLRIPAGEYRKILAITEEATRRGRMTPDLKRWSKARFIRDGKTWKVKVRVRGNNPNHWSDARKSWRVRFPKNDPFEGQREINLIIPTDNKGIHQAFALAVYRRLGLITQRDGYCILRINGVPQGVYYRVEHIDAPLLAHNRRPESTVFTNPKEEGGGGLTLGCFKEQITDNADEAWQALASLLEYETEPTPENLRTALAVTDMDDYLGFIAGTTLFCSDHNSLVTDNHKLYYDTSRGLFYRIPWDCAPNRIPRVQRFDMADWRATFDIYARWPMSKLRVAVIRDKSFRLRRDRLLWGLVADDSLLKLFDDTYNGLEMAFWSDVMGRGDEEARIARFRGIVRNNIRTIRGILSNSQATLHVRGERGDRVAVQFAINNASGIMMTQLQLDGRAPGSVYSLSRKPSNGARDGSENPIARATADESGTVRFEFLPERMLPDTGLAENFPAYLYQSENGLSRYKTKPLRTVVFPKTARYDYLITRESGGAPSSRARPSIEVRAFNAVTDAMLSATDLNIRVYSAADSFAPARRTQSVERFLETNREFVTGSYSDGRDAVKLPPGTHLFDRTVIVPEGVSLVIEPGATLKMGAGASLVCYGPVVASGTKQEPIRIVPSGDAAWGTFAIVRPGAESVFRRVEILGGSGATVDGITFTGALAIHDGDAVIEHCWIHGCSAEDAVNVKNGAVRIESTRFADNRSDAIDLDFVHGSVTGCRFTDTGGDAVDVSGSRVTIAGNRIERAGDKGISIGEESQVHISETLVVDSTYGVAVKDRSDARIERCTFIGNRNSVAAYCKKPIFGGAKAVVTDSVLLDTMEPVMTDGKSTLKLTGCLLPDYSASYVGATAPAGLADYLRSNGFVLDNDSPGGAGETSRSRPGITSPPVDLR